MTRTTQPSLHQIFSSTASEVKNWLAHITGITARHQARRAMLVVEEVERLRDQEPGSSLEAVFRAASRV